MISSFSNFLKGLKPSYPSSSSTILNSDGVPAKLSSNGKYYCSRHILTCPCCDGKCGPSNGCNCKACQSLDIKLGDFKPNLANYPAKKGPSGLYYCQRHKLSCSCCNGTCGPTNGHNCADCRYLDLQAQNDARINYEGAKAIKSVKTKKYYCGRKVLKCSCCKGYCGLNDGCNCKACQWLDIQSLPNVVLNQENEKAVKDKNGRFYCGRKTANCSCCPSGGWCLPGSGYCNCKACGWLSDRNESFAQKIEDPTNVLKSFLGLILSRDVPLDVVKAVPGVRNVYLKFYGDKSEIEKLTLGDLVLYLDRAGVISRFYYVM